MNGNPLNVPTAKCTAMFMRNAGKEHNKEKNGGQ